MKRTSSTFVYFTTTHHTTMILWILSRLRRMTRALERSPRAKARLSTCDLIGGRSRNFPDALLIKRYYWMIMAHIPSVENCHRPIVENQPSLLVANRYNRMAGLALVVLHDDEPEVVACNSQFVQDDVFYNGVIFAIAGATAQRLKRRGPEIGIAILGPVARRFDAHIDRAIDPSKPCAPLALPAKFDDRQKPKHGLRTDTFT